MNTSEDPDKDVLTGLMSGDERALAELMKRHLSRIHAVAARILGDRALAEDVAQSVFLKTWKMAPNWEPGKARLLSWMLRVTTNQCFDMLKKKSPIYTDDVPELTDGAASADHQIISHETSERVKYAINQLPIRQKTALTLSYYEDVSQKEGAKIMEITESAYESLLVRARMSLKKKFFMDSDLSTPVRKAVI